MLEDGNLIEGETDGLHLGSKESEGDQGTEPQDYRENLQPNHELVWGELGIAPSGSQGQVDGGNNGPYTDGHTDVDADWSRQEIVDDSGDWRFKVVELRIEVASIGELRSDFAETSVLSQTTTIIIIIINK